MQIEILCKWGKFERNKRRIFLLFNDRQLVNVSGFAKKWAFFEQPGHEASCVTDQAITIISPVTCFDQPSSALKSVF